MKEETTMTDKKVDHQLVEDFSSQVAKAASPMEVKEELDNIMAETNTQTADELIVEYLDYQERFLEKGIANYQDEMNRLQEYFDLETETIDAKDIKEAELKGFFLSFTNAGFRFIAVEGTLMPIVDYSFLDGYKTYVSEDISEYGRFMALNSNQPWARDGGIMIPLSDLADRIAMAEMYVSDYPDAVMKEEVIRQYTLYLHAFLVGLDNTPLVSDDEKEVDAGFVKAFYYFMERYPALKTTELVQLLMNELERTVLMRPYSTDDEAQKAAFEGRIDQKITEITETF